MPKKQLKARLLRRQNNECAITGQSLPSDDLSLVDTHRATPKAEGGTYTDANTSIVDPVAHMAEHGNLRTRDEVFELLKSIFDDRVQTLKLQNKVENQLRAYRRRTDYAHPDTEKWLADQIKGFERRTTVLDRALAVAVKHLATYDPLVATAMRVKGLGPITVAALQVYVDLTKANSASALWAYTGLDKPSHERFEKGRKGGGNKTLRTALWNSANTIGVRMRTSPYRLVYDQVKQRLALSEKITTTRNTDGHLVETAWKDTKDCHRHGAALRAVMKHLLADYWFVGRTLAGLPTRPLYAEEKLGHTGIVDPVARGWKIEK